MRLLAVTVVLLGWSFVASANLSTAPDLPLSHCYHWLKEGAAQILQKKYDHAKANGGELTFFGSTGVAGNGLYCAKTLNGSWNYGDRAVRVDFVPDIVFTYNGSKTCGTDGKFYSDATVCATKSEDVNLYSDTADWYVIRNENAVQFWSANSDQLIADLRAAQTDPLASIASKAHFEKTIALMLAERATLPKHTFFNSKSRVDLMKVINSPALFARANPSTMLDQLATYPSEKISAGQRSSLMSQLVRRIFNDKTSAVSSTFTATIDASPALQASVTAFVKTMSAQNIASFNSSAVFALGSSKTVKVPQALLNYAWLQRVKTPEGIIAIGSMQADDPNLARALANFVGPLAFAKAAALMTPAQASTYAKFLDKNAPAGKDFGPILQLLVARMATQYAVSTLTSWVSTMVNPSLHKETVMANTLSVPGLDTVLTAAQQFTFLSGLSDTIPEARYQTLRAQAALRMINDADVVKTPTYQIFTAVSDLKWPDDLTRNAFFNKAIERSIKERGQATATSTYRLMSSQILAMMLSQVRAEQPGPVRDAKAKSMKAFWTSLATRMSASTYADYAYPALELAAVMDAVKVSNSVDTNPMIPMLATASTPAGLSFLSLGSQALDSTLMGVAMEAIKTNSAGALGAKALVRRTLTYIASPAFALRVKSPGFKIANKEKMAWKSVPQGKSGLGSDACVFNKGILIYFNTDLAAKFPELWPAAEKAMKTYSLDMCPTN